MKIQKSIISDLRTSSKGQSQTMEPIITIVILAVLAAIGIIFFMRVGDTQQNVEIARVEELQSIEVLKLVTTMPELSCPKSVTTDTYCIDLYKAISFARLMNDGQNRIYYQPLFGTSRVTLTYIHIPSGDKDTIELFNLIAKDSNLRATSTHFTVYDPILKEKKMAILTVQRESR